jgi:hypothetical protein
VKMRRGENWEALASFYRAGGKARDRGGDRPAVSSCSWHRSFRSGSDSGERKRRGVGSRRGRNGASI